MTATTIETIKEKLTRLKTLADNTSNEGEAQAAVAAIQRLLMQYNLEMSDIPEGDDATEEYEDIEYDLESTSHTVFTFRRAILHTVAEHNFCRVIGNAQPKQKYQKIYGLKRTSKIHIIGQRSNVEVVIALYEFLVEEIRHLTRNAWKVADKSFDISESEWKKSFRLGAVHKLQERFRAQAKEVFASPNTNALVVQKEKELQDAVDNLIGQTKSTLARRQTIITTAYQGGKINADSLKIQDAIVQRKPALNA